MNVQHNNSVANITTSVVANKAFFVSPRVLFSGTDAEETAESMIKNLYGKDGKLDIGIATELVILGQMQDCGNDQVAFSSLYGFLKPADKLRFGEVVDKVLETGKKTLQQAVEYEKKNGGGEEKKHETKPEQATGNEKKDQQPKREPVKQAAKQPTDNGNGKKKPTQQEAGQAANSLGFNINNFLNPQQQVQQQQRPHYSQRTVVVPQQQQVNPMPNPAATVQQPIPQATAPKNDPMPNATLDERVAELKKHFKLIDGTHPGMTADRINSLLFLTKNGQLKADMKKYDAKSRANNIFMQEIEMPDEFKGQYDFCFRMTTKNPKKFIRVLFNSEQKYEPNINQWVNAVQIDLCDSKRK